ncbi:VTT domain-containing protein [Candidatus Pacearchaeota archaeon]|nr:VTT domain-containing protein [Candidatus Pacearchaeota archaeon]
MILDFLIHTDTYLNSFIAGHGLYVALGVLILVIFCETGLVFAPFLPGDSIIFVAGATLAARPGVVLAAFVLLSLAAIGGDTVNYWVGNTFGKKVIAKLKKEYIDKTNAFYHKHGAKTIVLARFVPIIRTFAPFVAGLGSMEYKKFLRYNVFGGITWVGLFLFGGYFFGTIPIIKGHLSLVTLIVIILSFIPPAIELLRKK